MLNVKFTSCKKMKAARVSLSGENLFRLLLLKGQQCSSIQRENFYLGKQQPPQNFLTQNYPRHKSIS